MLSFFPTFAIRLLVHSLASLTCSDKDGPCALPIESAPKISRSDVSCPCYRLIFEPLTGKAVLLAGLLLKSQRAGAALWLIKFSLAARVGFARVKWLRVASFKWPMKCTFKHLWRKTLSYIGAMNANYTQRNQMPSRVLAPLFNHIFRRRRPSHQTNGRCNQL